MKLGNGDKWVGFGQKSKKLVKFLPKLIDEDQTGYIKQRFMSITDLKFEIDRDSKTPLWLQIRNELFNCLYRDELRPGQLIPNEKTLVELFNVSIGTIRKAVGMLEKEGFLIRKQGLGTFVFQHDNSSFLFEYFHLLNLAPYRIG